MGKCKHHPGRTEAVNLNGVGYCEQCRDGIEAAGKKVDKHVEPKACFVWYKDSKTGWTPITGYGCAHWVAHQLNIKRGKQKCLLGFPGRIKELIAGMSVIKDLTKVRKGAIWTSDKLTHCGIVESIKVVKGKDPEIRIRHDSTKLGKVAVGDWAKYFKSVGKFYK